MAGRARTCPTPHPIRAGYDSRGEWLFADTLEIVGGCVDCFWVCCNACGSWFWVVCETGEFAYRNEWRLPSEAAERALRGHDPGPIVALLVEQGLPGGPRWEPAGMRVELLRHMTPGHGDVERIAALRAQARLDGAWSDALAQLIAEQAARHVAPAGALEFIIDLRRDMAGCEEVFELPGAVIVPLPERDRLLRFNEQGGVEIPLPGPLRLLARQADGLLFAIEGPTPSLRLLRPDTMLGLPSPEGVRMSALALDRGHWLLIPDPPPTIGTPRAELRDAKLEFVASLPMIRDPVSARPASPRAMAGGWLASDVVSDAGDRIGLCLFDEQWQVVARSEAIVGGRECEVVDDERLLAVPTGELRRLEGWRRHEDRFERIFELACDAHVRAGEHSVCIEAGEVTGRDLEGRLRWRSRWGIGRIDRELIVLGSSRVLVRDDRQLVLIDADTGGVIMRFEAELDGKLWVDRPGWAHVITGDELLSCNASGMLESTPLAGRHEIVEAAGIGVVVRAFDDRSRHLWIACNGEPIATFEADEPRWSGHGSSAGPHVLERERLRIHRLPGG